MHDPAIDMLRRQARQSLQHRDYETASRACLTILSRHRKDCDALVMLAQAQLEVGRADEACETMKRAVKAEPKNAVLRLQLGQILAARGDYSGALVQLDRSLKIDPTYRPAVATKAAVLERQNKYERAESLLKPFIRGDYPPEICAVYMRVLLHRGENETAVDVGRTMQAKGHKPSQGLRDALFALAKAEERAGDHGAAIDSARQANAVSAPHFDPGAAERQFDETIAAFTRAAIQRAPRPADPNELPVFIVGMPRCGSTLIERILDTHPDVHGAGEIPTFHRLVDSLPEVLGTTTPYPACIGELTAEVVETQAEAYIGEIVAGAPQASRVVNKDLGNFKHLGLINVLLPRAKVIHCRRSPLDTCLSCYFEPLTPASAPYAGDLEHLGFYFRQYERLMTHWRSVIDVPFLEVEYEAVVADLEPQVRRLLEFVGVEWHEACLEFHRRTRDDRTLSFDQVRRPLYGSAVGRAERFGAHLDPLRAALAGVGTNHAGK